MGIKPLHEGGRPVLGVGDAKTAESQDAAIIDVVYESVEGVVGAGDLFDGMIGLAGVDAFVRFFREDAAFQQSIGGNRGHLWP